MLGNQMEVRSFQLKIEALEEMGTSARSTASLKSSTLFLRFYLNR